MKGRVDGGGRALVPVLLRSRAEAELTPLEAWIDTGFTGELVLPQATISELNLPQSGTVSAELGDGSSVVMNTYTCLIDWFDNEQQIEVIANEGQCLLLGVGLLRDRKLTVDYRSKSVEIE